MAVSTAETARWGMNPSPNMKIHPLLRSLSLAAALLAPLFSAAQTVSVVTLLPSTEAPTSLAMDTAGNAYLPAATSIFRVSPTGALSTWATLPALPPGVTGRFQGMKFDATGHAYVVGTASRLIWKISPAGQVSTFTEVPGSRFLNDFDFDRSGNLYVTDSLNNVIYKVSPTGVAETWSSHPLLRPRTAPTVYPNLAFGTNGILVSPQGDVYATVTQPGRIVRIPVNANGSAGTPQVFVEDELLAGIDDMVMDTNGDIYAAINIFNRIVVIKPDGRVSTVAAGGLFSVPTTVAFGRAPGTERTLFVCNNGHLNFPGAEAAKTGLLRIDIGTLANPAASATGAMAARGRVGTGADVLVAGFTVDGPRSKTVIIRGIGPALGALGVTGVLSDPLLQVYAGGTLVDSNDNWGSVAGFTALSASRGAFPLTAGSRDAALMVTLAPGSYTAQVSGVGGATGIALLEIYDVP